MQPKANISICAAPLQCLYTFRGKTVMMAVIYVDMDYFYAACEELRHPEYIGKPFAVGTSSKEGKLKGVVQTANYAARKYGIKSGMSNADAFKLCKGLLYEQADEPYYEGISKSIMAILKSYGFPFEQCSIDEAAIDVPMPCDEAYGLGKRIKERIMQELRLPCTVGISFGKVFAKMACDAAKPDGVLLVDSNSIKQFLSGKPVSAIPGIGPKASEKLKSMHILAINDLASASAQLLAMALGSFGSTLHDLANGLDNSTVSESSEILSISRERTLPNPTVDMQSLEAAIRELAREVASEASKKGLWFKGIGVKIRYEDFTQVTRNLRLSHYSASEDGLSSIAIQLVRKNASKKIRKLGVRVYSLMEARKQRQL